MDVYISDSKERKEAITRDFSGKRKLVPTKMPLDIIFENDEFLALNKEYGISLHPGKGERNRATLIEGLMYYGNQNEFEPFLVHRLDRNTSGVLLVAKKREFSRYLSELISGRNIKKEYICLVVGKIVEKMVINSPIDEKEAETEILDTKYIEYRDKIFSLANVRIGTGRKHQIRKHLKSIDHPILGDDDYGDRTLNRDFRKYGLKRPFLHCSRMSFYDDRSGDNIIIEANLSDDLNVFLRHIENNEEEL